MNIKPEEVFILNKPELEDALRPMIADRFNEKFESKYKIYNRSAFNYLMPYKFILEQDDTDSNFICYKRISCTDIELYREVRILAHDDSFNFYQFSIVFVNMDRYNPEYKDHRNLINTLIQYEKKVK